MRPDLDPGMAHRRRDEVQVRTVHPRISKQALRVRLELRGWPRCVLTASRYETPALAGLLALHRSQKAAPDVRPAGGATVVESAGSRGLGVSSEAIMARYGTQLAFAGNVTD